MIKEEIDSNAALTRKEREDLILDPYYNQNKTFRQITKEAKISPRDIKTIVYQRGIAIDSSDNVYVTDLIPNTLSYRVQMFTSDGVFITSWGSLGGSGSTTLQFNGYGIAIDNSNNVYVADTFSNRIQTTDGTFTKEFGSPGSGNGQFDTPHDEFFDTIVKHIHSNIMYNTV